MTRSEFEHNAVRLRPLMLQVAFDFFGNSDDAEDATQEAMVALWHYCERIDPHRNVEGLAVRVAKNCCVSWWRGSMPHGCDTWRTAHDSSPTPHELLEAREARQMLNEVIARLKPRERELFEMRQIEGLTVDEIVTQTGLQKASVKVMISVARKKVLTELKQLLKP